MCVCTHVGAHVGRGQRLVSEVLLSHSPFLWDSLSLSLDLTSEFQGSTSSTHTQDQVLGLQTYAGARLFMWVLGSWTQVLMRTWQALHWLNYLPLVVCLWPPPPTCCEDMFLPQRTRMAWNQLHAQVGFNLQFSPPAHWVLELHAYTSVPEPWQCWCYLQVL